MASYFVSKKFKSKDGGPVLIITLIVIMITFIATLPAIIDSSTIHISSKKLKTHLNAISNSSAMLTAEVNQDGFLAYTPDEGFECVKNMCNEIFDKKFVSVGAPTQNDTYYTNTLITDDNKIAVQYFFYNNPETVSTQPVLNDISNKINVSSSNSNVNVDKIVGTTSVNKPTVIILMRYDLKTFINKSNSSMVRIAASQINISLD
ncbi:MAG: hypothetical protein RR620_08760 [Clostridium sp.]